MDTDSWIALAALIFSMSCTAVGVTWWLSRLFNRQEVKAETRHAVISGRLVAVEDTCTQIVDSVRSNGAEILELKQHGPACDDHRNRLAERQQFLEARVAQIARGGA